MSMTADPIEQEKKEQEKTDFKSVQVLADAISKAIGDSHGDQRFIDMTRIPLICLSIAGMHENLKEIKDMVKGFKDEFVSKEAFKPIQKVVYGLVGLILTSVVFALLALVIQKQ